MAATHHRKATRLQQATMWLPALVRAIGQWHHRDMRSLSLSLSLSRRAVVIGIALAVHTLVVNLPKWCPPTRAKPIA